MSRQGAAGLAPLAFSLMLIISAFKSFKTSYIIHLPSSTALRVLLPVLAIAVLASIPRLINMLHSSETCFVLYTSSIAPSGKLYAELASIAAALRSLSKSRGVRDVQIEYLAELDEPMRLCIRYNEKIINKRLLENIIFNYSRYILHGEAASNGARRCTTITVRSVTKAIKIIMDKKARIVVDMRSYLRNTPVARTYAYIDVGDRILVASKIAAAKRALSRYLRDEKLRDAEIIIVKPVNMPDSLLRGLVDRQHKCTLINIK